MIRTSDKEYEATKRIKQGQEQLAPPFAELARWIEATWAVTILNVVYDPPVRTCARLQVILEQREDVWKVYQEGEGFDPEKQRAIVEKLSEIVERDEIGDFDVEELSVVFSAFAPLAKEDADNQISEEEVQALRHRLGNPDLWKIDRCFGRVTFFFYTDEQARRYETEGRKKVYARLYFDLLKPHDEFGYLRGEAFEVRFDSKQNFDEHYESNWYYYYL
jgi:hypothetical protein